MNKENRIREDYRKVLLELGVLRRFKKNLAADSIETGLTIGQEVRILNECETFVDLVLSSFTWGATPEEDDFWIDIKDRGNKIWLKNKNNGKGK